MFPSLSTPLRLSTLWCQSWWEESFKSPGPPSICLPVGIILLKDLSYSFRMFRAVPTPFIWGLQKGTWLIDRFVVDLLHWRFPLVVHFLCCAPKRRSWCLYREYGLARDLLKCNFHLPPSALQGFASGNSWDRFLPGNVLDIWCLGRGVKPRERKLWLTSDTLLTSCGNEQVTSSEFIDASTTWG